MNWVSIIIPSKTLSNVAECIRSLNFYSPNTRIFVVDDGIDWGPGPDGPACDRAWVDGRFVHVLRGEKPFVFARNCNIGIKAAGDDDVILLNDDALLKTRHGFIDLQLSDKCDEFGMIAPVTNVTGARDQTPHGVGLREVNNIAFVCVYIPRRTLNTVGLLDERFSSYGWEDTDYCRRVKMAGLKIGVYDHCFVDHGSLVSTFRGHANNAGDIEPGRKIFQEKWGANA